MKVKKGDKVLITSGKYRGKSGAVLKVFPSEGRLIVDGANLVKKRVKPKKSGEKGKVVEMPSPLPAAKVKIICPKCKKAARIGYRFIEEKGKKKKARFCKKCSQAL